MFWLTDCTWNFPDRSFFACQSEIHLTGSQYLACDLSRRLLPSCRAFAHANTGGGTLIARLEFLFAPAELL